LIKFLSQKIQYECLPTPTHFADFPCGPNAEQKVALVFLAAGHLPALQLNFDPLPALRPLLIGVGQIPGDQHNEAEQKQVFETGIPAGAMDTRLQLPQRSALAVQVFKQHAQAGGQRQIGLGGRLQLQQLMSEKKCWK